VTEFRQEWFPVTACEKIPLREGKAIEVAGRQIAVFNLGESFLAVESRCPHRGGPLADGMLSGSSIVCPLHAWTFNLATGAVANHPESPACLARFPVRVQQGMIFVQVPVESLDAGAAAASLAHRDRPIRWVQRKAPAPSSDFSDAAGAPSE
jgi:nitrite reductase (NADH) small subunit